MHPVKKFAIIGSVGVALMLGAWTYACCANVPFVSDMARGATHSMALSMGLHVFDPPAATGSDEKKETVANLPEGYYVFVGQKPAHSAPKWVVVNPGGTIQWLANETPAAAPGGTTAVPANNAAAKGTGATAAKGDWKEYNYPHIKWNPKALAHTNGGVAQLETTYEPGSDGQPGMLKYQLLILKDQAKRAHEVELEDKDGFKIFSFAANEWHDLPASDASADSQLMEAKDSIAMPEDKYRDVRNYEVH